MVCFINDERGSVDNTLSHSFIRLSWDDPRRIYYTGERSSDDVGIATARQAIRALDVTNCIANLFSTMEDLKEELGKWVAKRQDKIHKAFFTKREDCFVLLIVKKESAFDEEFEDDLSDLSIVIAQDNRFKIIPFSVQSLPFCQDDCYKAFCNPDFTYACELHNAAER